MQRASLIGSLVVAVLSICSLGHAQDVDLCAIDRDPSQFCGKMITVRATTWHGVHHYGLENEGCKTALGWRTPEQKGTRVHFKLKRDESWQTFTHYDAMSSDIHGGQLPDLSESLESLPPPPPPNYLITTTFKGQLVCKRKQIPWFFLVVESVSDVKTEQVY